MSKNTTTSGSERFRLPGGFIVALLLIVATESVLFVQKMEYIPFYWTRALLNAGTLIRHAPDADAIILGNSLQQTGIDPTRVSDNLLNLSLPGAKPMAEYFVFKRYLAFHSPPRALFLFLDPEDLEEALPHLVLYFLNAKDMIEAWRDLPFRAHPLLMRRYFSSLELKLALKMRKGLSRDTPPMSVKDFQVLMERGRGFLPAPSGEGPLADDYFVTCKTSTSGQEARRPDQRSVTMPPREMEYIDKIVALARENKVTVIVCGSLVPEKLYTIFEKNGFGDNCRIFMNKIKERYPDILFAGEPIIPYEHAYYSDAHHLNKAGAERYTEYFKNVIYAPYRAWIEQSERKEKR